MIRRILYASLLVALAAVPALAENWPQWRGPALNGTSGEKDLPVHWSRTENVIWKLAMPSKTGATPIIWGNRIFLTSADGSDCVLLCVATEGTMVWKKKIGGGNKAFKGDEANSASSSPSTDGKHVWCFFASGELEIMLKAYDKQKAENARHWWSGIFGKR